MGEFCFRLLRICLVALGSAAIGIGLMFVVIGPATTAGAFVSFLEIVYTPQPVATGFNNANVDNELRFYSVFWIAYGIALVACARDLDSKFRWIPYLILLFLAGGIARLFSLWQFGEPHLLFQILIGIELILPVLMSLLWVIAGGSIKQSTS